MINSVVVTKPNGEYLTIDMRNPEQSGFFIRSIEGLGPPKVMLNTGDNLYSDGGYYNSSRYSQRNLVFSLGFYETKTESIEQIRNKTYKYFPAKTQLTITIHTDTKSAFTTGYVETNEPNIFSREEGAQISIVCPNPFFYSKDYIPTIFSGLTGGFEFPFENASLVTSTIQFSTIVISTQGNVYYDADIENGVYIYMKLLGAVTNPVIYNATNGQSMSINSTTVAALVGSGLTTNDLIIISSERGNKQVLLCRDGLYYNILSAVGNFASWFTLSQGDNVFTYTASSGVSNIQFSIYHRLVYGGI